MVKKKNLSSHFTDLFHFFLEIKDIKIILIVKKKQGL